MFSQPQNRPNIRGYRAVGTRFSNREIVPKLAVGLVLVSSAVGVWLALEGIGAASLDLAVAKWVQLLALCVLIAGSAWTVLSLRRPYKYAIREASPLWHLEFSRLANTAEYAAAALVGGGLYVLVAYSLRFGEHYGPWYNGLIGLQGFVLLLLANVVYLSALQEPQVRGSGLSKLIVMLSLLSLLLMAALDILPYRGG